MAKNCAPSPETHFMDLPPKMAANAPQVVDMPRKRYMNIVDN